MTIDSSPIPIPPAVPDQCSFTAHHDQLLNSVVAQLGEVTARLEALETHIGMSQSTARPATTAIPTWRTKTGRQTGWQPARR